MRRLPPLNYLKSFECVARWLNLTRAAQELNVTAGAVSKAILNLEAHLNLALFERNHKRLTLTPAGQSYLEQVTKALDVLSHATEEVMLHRGHGSVIRIGSLPTFSLSWLIPKLPSFKAKFPQFSIDVKTVPSDFTFGIDQLDLEEMDIDVVFYFGNPDYPGFTQTPIANEKLLPIASPAQKKALDQLGNTPGKDQNFPLLLQQLPFLQHSTRPFVWQRWFEKYQCHYQEPTWIARFEHYYMLIEAAIAGLGIALVPQLLIQDALDEGKLIALEQQGITMEASYFMLSHQSRSEEIKIRCFKEWVLSMLSR